MPGEGTSMGTQGHARLGGVGTLISTRLNLAWPRWCFSPTSSHPGPLSESERGGSVGSLRWGWSPGQALLAWHVPLQAGAQPGL